MYAVSAAVFLHRLRQLLARFLVAVVFGVQLLLLPLASAVVFDLAPRAALELQVPARFTRLLPTAEGRPYTHNDIKWAKR